MINPSNILVQSFTGPSGPRGERSGAGARGTVGNEFAFEIFRQRFFAEMIEEGVTMQDAQSTTQGENIALKIPEPRWGYKLSFLLGGAAFAFISYVAGTLLYEMELSLAQQSVVSWGRLGDALVAIEHNHLLTFIPWIIGTTLFSIALGYLFDKQVQYRQVAEKLAAYDGLTMLATRRVLMTGLAREVSRAERNISNVFSLLMIDVDDFKHYNDTYGHLGGDKVLQNVSSIVRGCLRASDVAGRFGGEEILVVLAGADLRQAAIAAERLRGKIEAESEVTVSIGVASYPDHGHDVTQLIRKADDAMYNAKRSGKNRVCVATPQPSLVDQSR